MNPVVSAEYLSVDDFPKHIKSLVQKEKESEEQEKRQREIERNTCKVQDFSGLTQDLCFFRISVGRCFDYFFPPFSFSDKAFLHSSCKDDG